MRYIGLIKSEGCRYVRGILSTGYADPHTRNALQGRHLDEHIDWWIYGLVGGQLKVQKIDGSTVGPPRRYA